MYLSSCDAMDNCSCALTSEAIATHSSVRLSELQQVPMQEPACFDAIGCAEVSSDLHDAAAAAADVVDDDLLRAGAVVEDDYYD